MSTVIIPIEVRDLTGQTIKDSIEEGVEYLVCSHPIEFMKGSKGWGFYINPYKVNAWKIEKQGFFGLSIKKTYIEKMDIEYSSKFVFYQEPKPLGDTLVSLASDDFTCRVGELSEVDGGKRGALSIDYVGYHLFEVSFSKRIGGDDLKLFKYDPNKDHGYQALQLAEKIHFIQSLKINIVRSFSMINFNEKLENEQVA